MAQITGACDAPHNKTRRGPQSGKQKAPAQNRVGPFF